MIGIRAEKKDAEATRAYLKAHKLIDKQHKVVGRSLFIYFPVTDIDDKAERELERLGARRVEMRFGKAESKKSYRQSLLRELGSVSYNRITKSYDIIGDTAVVNAGRDSAKKLAKVIMEINGNVKRVVRKSGAVSGIYRTRSFSHVAGKHGYVVRYIENGIIITLDIRRSFFSPRLAYERKRVSKAARDHENIVVMFAGVGPFALLLAKEHSNSGVVAMELNKDACMYMRQNISLNKLSNVIPVQGDVRKCSRKYKGFADRIVMPLPKDSYSFLGSALEMAKKRCVIHYYAFGEAEDPYSAHKLKIKRFFAGRKRSVEFLAERTVRSYSPKEVEVAIDFRISERK